MTLVININAIMQQLINFYYKYMFDRVIFYLKLIQMEPINNVEDKTVDSSMIFEQQTQDHFPNQFIWPKDQLSNTSTEVLNEHVIDLQGFLRHDEDATLHAAKLVKESCLTHGFFQVVNHGVDTSLLALADEHGRAFFNKPITEKLKCKQQEGSVVGFNSAHAQRFPVKLPWKEMLTIEYHENGPDEVAAEFFNTKLGSQYKETGYDAITISLLILF